MSSLALSAPSTNRWCTLFLKNPSIGAFDCSWRLLNQIRRIIFSGCSSITFNRHCLAFTVLDSSYAAESVSSMSKRESILSKRFRKRFLVEKICLILHSDSESFLVCCRQLISWVGNSCLKVSTVFGDLTVLRISYAVRLFHNEGGPAILDSYLLSIWIRRGSSELT